MTALGGGVLAAELTGDGRVGRAGQAIGLARGLPRGNKATTESGAALLARLHAAKGGDRIVLPPGDYGAVKIAGLAFSPQVRLDGAGATFSSLVLDGVSGLALAGGTVRGLGGRSYGINIRSVKDVAIERMTVTGAHRGLVIGGSDGLLLSDLNLTGLLSDGIDLAMSRNVVIRRISCSNFTPTATTFDAAGKRLTVGDHPDCIQAWSRPKAPPVSDVLIEDSRMEGKMQGIFFGNHVRNGVDDGGYDRITIRNNRIRVMHPNGIALMDARDSRVTGNVVENMPGGVNPRRPDSPVRTWLRVSGTVAACGNTVPDFPRDPSTRKCS